MEKGGAEMSAEENKQVVRDFIEYLKTKDFDRLADLFSEDFTWVVPARSPTLAMLRAPRNKASASSE